MVRPPAGLRGPLPSLRSTRSVSRFAGAAVIVVALTLPVMASCVGDENCSTGATCSLDSTTPAEAGTGADASLPDGEVIEGGPNAPPAVTSVDNRLGDTGGGTSLTITGTGFGAVTEARVGGVPLSNFVAVNATTITGTTGPHAKGVVDVLVNGVRGSGTAAGAFEYFDPTAIANCVWWLRADRGVTVNAGNEVTAWADQSGIGDPARDAVPVSADKTTWNASDPAYNKKATVGTFAKPGASLDCRLRTGTWNATYSANGATTAVTLGVIGHAPEGNNRYFTFGSTSDYLALVGQLAAGTVYSAGAQSLLQGSGVGPARTDNPKTLLLGEFNGAQSRLLVNATTKAAATGDLGAATTLGDEPFSIGSYPGDSAAFGVERIAEVFAYSRLLTEPERTKLRQYLNGRYDKGMIE